MNFKRKILKKKGKIKSKEKIQEKRIDSRVLLNARRYEQKKKDFKEVVKVLANLKLSVQALYGALTYADLQKIAELSKLSIGKVTAITNRFRESYAREQCAKENKRIHREKHKLDSNKIRK